MVSLHFEKGRCGLKLRPLLASFVVVLLSHLTLTAVPHLFGSITVTSMLPIAATVMVSTYALAGWFRRLLGITASAPAVVTGHVMFLFGVHLTINRKALLDTFLEVECILLLIGLYRFVYGDPGLAIESSNNAVLGVTSNPELGLKFKSSILLSRVRHCNLCNRSVKGFDHHCPAFGNCIGQKNHRLFMLLITLLITMESMYAVRASQCM
ncbi:hypothetical protein HPP92_020776 [Vanilla planifolia]|uniref:S-acyltransferase n=1 Tax=Vanilla planifolia TaxID=51239 RepID=A0A835Q139_VANPL|nr:hypothetical protein HPP92_020776 [Vanilla planifolia]